MVLPHKYLKGLVLLVCCVYTKPPLNLPLFKIGNFLTSCNSEYLTPDLSLKYCFLASLDW